MKNITLFFLIALATLMSGCQSSSNAVWEDTKTASRYLQRKGKALMGKSSESRMVANNEDFYGPAENDFIPLRDEDLKAHVVIPQPKSVPGESTVPGIDMFVKPAGDLAKIFKSVHFNTDEHIVRSEDEQETLKHIASYLKKHPDTMIFVAGYCDERASESYNLALGTRRSNSVRESLAKLGVHPEQIYTTSYGKEDPVDLGHSRQAWSKNRRAEFKIYKAQR